MMRNTFTLQVRNIFQNVLEEIAHVHLLMLKNISHHLQWLNFGKPCTQWQSGYPDWIYKKHKAQLFEKHNNDCRNVAWDIQNVDPLLGHSWWLFSFLHPAKIENDHWWNQICAKFGSLKLWMFNTRKQVKCKNLASQN